jgi:H+/Cl- antiporter ClcA
VQQRLTTFTSSPVTWAYLLILGLTMALMGVTVEISTGEAHEARMSVTSTLSGGAAFLVWCAWCATGAVVATAICHVGKAPQAEGSGIPQIKSIMAGTPLAGMLSARVLAAKFAGLVAAQGGGLQVGKEGPFVHMAGALAAQLCRLPLFAPLFQTETRRRQLLAAAVAAGVTAVFGTPVGGVLFSLEITSTYTLVSSQVMCFVAAIVTRLAFDALWALFAGTGWGGAVAEGGSFAVSIPTTFTPAQAWELPLLALLGIGCGLLGSLFVYVMHKAKLTAKLLMKPRPSVSPAPAGGEETLEEWARKHWPRYVLCASVGALVAALTFPTSFLALPDMDVLTDLLLCPPGMLGGAGGGEGGGHSSCPRGVWASAGNTAGAAAIASLATFLVVRFVTVVLSISLPLPCGTFQPLIILGAAVGRLAGELVLDATRVGGGAGAGIQPGLWAVVGAAAMVSGATHTISTVVILFELTGQAVHLVPVLAGTLLAYAASSAFTLPLYDVLMLAGSTPYLPRVHPAAAYAQVIARDMARPLPAASILLEGVSTYADVLRALQATARALPLAPGARATDAALQPSILQALPIVADGSMLLVGTLDRAACVALLRSGPPEGGATTAQPVVTVAASGVRDDERKGLIGRRLSASSLEPALVVEDAGVAAWAAWDTEGGRADKLPAQPAGWMRSALLPIQRRETSGGGHTGGLVLDEAPMCLDIRTPLARVHFLFALLLLPHALVTDGRTLVGLVMKEDVCAA